MVHRNKDIANPPADLIDPQWNNLKAQALVDGNNHEANTSCYRDCTIDSLIDLYKNKCAICERDRGEELQVDHYRPFKPRDNITNPQYNQTGYYWLSYEWSNLIPLCSKCNNLKSNKFPLIGWNGINRISGHLNTTGIVGFQPYDRDWLQIREMPFMVNPEYDLNPERHFIYTREGRMRSTTNQGVETINICGLNRKDLIRIRLKLRDRYINKIKLAFDDYNNTRIVAELRGALKSVFREIRDGCDIDSEFSLLHTFIYNYFDYFIDNKLPVSLRGQALKYFNQFKIANVI